MLNSLWLDREFQVFTIYCQLVCTIFPLPHRVLCLIDKEKREKNSYIELNSQAQAGKRVDNNFNLYFFQHFKSINISHFLSLSPLAVCLVVLTTTTDKSDSKWSDCLTSNGTTNCKCSLEPTENSSPSKNIFLACSTESFCFANSTCSSSLISISLLLLLFFCNSN